MNIFGLTDIVAAGFVLATGMDSWTKIKLFVVMILLIKGLHSQLGTR